MNLFTTQLIVAVALFLGTFFCGVFPALVTVYIFGKKPKRSDDGRLDVRPQSASLLCFSMCFGGGILLATCFVHLIPETRINFNQHEDHDISHHNETLEEHESHHHDHRFFSPELVICLGFFLIFFFEELIHMLIDHHHQHQNTNSALPHHTTCHHPKQKEAIVDSNGHDHPETNDQHQEKCALRDKKKMKNKLIKDRCASYGSTSTTCQIADHSNPQDCEVHIDTIVNCEVQMGVTSFFRGFMIIIALSFHSIFEGLTIGLQNTVADVWQLFVAIAVHKLIISLAIGLEIFSESLQFRRVFTYMLVFSLVSPIGIILGAVATFQVSAIVIGWVNALATGSILYIIFYEILSRERHSQHLRGYLQLLGIFSGFCVMVLLNRLAGEHAH